MYAEDCKDGESSSWSDSGSESSSSGHSSNTWQDSPKHEVLQEESKESSGSALEEAAEVEKEENLEDVLAALSNTGALEAPQPKTEQK